MAVCGVGMDVVDVGGFSDQLDVPGSRFESGSFTVGELRDAAGSAERLAARWAAKEAFVKAWSGCRHGQSPTLAAWEPADIEVVLDFEGRPSISLRGKVASAVDAGGDLFEIHVSLSHDGGFAAAVVVLDRPNGST